MRYYQEITPLFAITNWAVAETTDLRLNLKD